MNTNKCTDHTPLNEDGKKAPIGLTTQNSKAWLTKMNDNDQRVVDCWYVMNSGAFVICTNRPFTGGVYQQGEGEPTLRPSLYKDNLVLRTPYL